MIGFLNVYKPQGMSSAAVVGKIKKCFNLSKVGHMGTLDPLACGILPIAIGKATRMFDYFQNKIKTYVVNAEFGYETASLDLGTKIINKTNNIPTLLDVKQECLSFIGKIKQKPPIYSAKNIKGEKAYNLARKGVEFDIKDVEVEIFEFNCIKQIQSSIYQFEIKCSSGTYVRSLIRDLARKLNSYATVTYLERTQTEFFDKATSVELSELLKSKIDNYLISVEKVFNLFSIIQVSESDFIKLKNGLKIKANNLKDKCVFIKSENKLLGVAENSNNELKIKKYLFED